MPGKLPCLAEHIAYFTDGRTSAGRLTQRVEDVAVTRGRLLEVIERDAVSSLVRGSPQHAGVPPVSLAVDALDALGVTDRMTHTEIRLTSTGPQVIEVNGRLGGYVQGLLASLTGANPVRVAIDLAAGARPRVPRLADLESADHAVAAGRPGREAPHRGGRRRAAQVLRESTTRIHVPTEMRFVESLPRTLSGKLNRAPLDQY